MGAPVAKLTPQLIGLEGNRVEVIDLAGWKRRFWVGVRHDGACHLEVRQRGKRSGYPAAASYQSVTLLDRGPYR